MTWLGMAKDLIDRFGADMTLVRQDVTYDPATGGFVASPRVEEEFVGAIRRVSSRDVNGVSILWDDQRVMCPGSLSMTPKVGDSILHRGREIPVRHVRTFDVSGEIVAYDCIVGNTNRAG